MSLALILGLLIYWPGLQSSFFFDDFGGLVNNEGIRLTHLSWEGLLRGAWSYQQSGPLGRPLTMATFSLGFLLHGLDPFWIKLENLLIHLLNGVLVFILTGQVVRLVNKTNPGREIDEEKRAFLILLVSACWLIHPMAFTSVLYAIQRMTSLAATCSLIGLIGFIHYREKSLTSDVTSNLFKASASLLIFTACALFNKENSGLTLGYAWLIEYFIFSKISGTQKPEKYWRQLCSAIAILTALAVAIYVLRDSSWLETRTPGRPYSPWERFLSELRVLIFYIRQIVAPDISLFGLYHDDWVISRNWTTPPSTVLAALFHLTLLAIAFFNARRLPLFALGVTWFYMGHLLESTVFPLELVHEHRNYLPTWGILLAAGSLLIQIKKMSRGIRWTSALAILMAFSSVTYSRAECLGRGVDYFIQEAKFHPKSSRANYDAANELLKLVKQGLLPLSDVAPFIANFLERSQSADSDALAPLVGKLTLAIMEGRRDRETLAELANRLRNGIPPNGIYAIAFTLSELENLGSEYFTNDDLANLYLAALANPELSGILRSIVLAHQGTLLAVSFGNLEGGLNALEEAVEITPSAVEIRLLYAGVLLQADQLDEAALEIRRIRSQDKFGSQKHRLEKLSAAMTQRLSTSGNEPVLPAMH